MRIGKGTNIPKLYITWPNQVKLGNDCTLEHGIYFKFSGIWEKSRRIEIGDRVFIGSFCEFNISDGINIGNDTNIASGCKFIDHDHGIEAGKLIGGQVPIVSPIEIGRDVWLGFNVTVLKGVFINDGAVIAAGSVVTKSVPKNEIWAGIPAKKIGVRKNAADEVFNVEYPI
ncbi:MAG: acyltransferase [Pyrinomonadaceae bacterium]|nr:acyltransferase [Sphingobacteriaceae bacterium]